MPDISDDNVYPPPIPGYSQHHGGNYHYMDESHIARMSQRQGNGNYHHVNTNRNYHQYQGRPSRSSGGQQNFRGWYRQQPPPRPPPRQHSSSHTHPPPPYHYSFGYAHPDIMGEPRDFPERFFDEPPPSPGSRAGRYGYQPEAWIDPETPTISNCQNNVLEPDAANSTAMKEPPQTRPSIPRNDESRNTRPPTIQPENTERASKVTTKDLPAKQAAPSQDSPNDFIAECGRYDVLCGRG